MSDPKPWWNGRGTTKPGEFRAYCRKPRPVLYVELTDAQRDRVEAAKRNARYDRKAGGAVVDVTCEFDTADRAEFEAHLKDVHGGPFDAIYSSWRRGTSFQDIAAGVRTHQAPLPVKAWRPPKLLADGRPFVDRDKRTSVCPACGTVVEVTAASALPEHGCTAAQVAS